MTSETTPAFDLSRCLAAELVGTALLLAVIIGSGVMGERLSGGNVAIALLANTLATAAGLVVLISIFAPISSAHFNPAVTLVMLYQRQLHIGRGAGYIAAQLAGAALGVWLAHLMFAEPVIQLSGKLREGGAQALSEAVATFGLIATILACRRFDLANAPQLIGLYIASAYWFTASTSFANPAVTVARALSDTFAGIAPSSVPAFLAAQLAGAAGATIFSTWLLRKERVA